MKGFFSTLLFIVVMLGVGLLLLTTPLYVSANQPTHTPTATRVLHLYHHFTHDGTECEQNYFYSEPEGWSPGGCPTETPKPTNTATKAPTATATNTVAPTNTSVPTNTATMAPTDTAVPTDTIAPTDTVVPTDTIVPTDTPQNTAVPTDTPQDTPTISCEGDCVTVTVPPDTQIAPTGTDQPDVQGTSCQQMLKNGWMKMFGNQCWDWSGNKPPRNDKGNLMNHGQPLHNEDEDGGA